MNYPAIGLTRCATSNPTDRISLVIGDITRIEADAIVTTANESLCGGSGVEGAVLRAAGPGLFEECRSMGVCPEGEARITKGNLLPVYATSVTLVASCQAVRG